MSAMTIIEIARAVRRYYGDRAESLMEKRAKQNKEAGDQEADALWSQVAAALHALSRSPAAGLVGERVAVRATLAPD